MVSQRVIVAVSLSISVAIHVAALLAARKYAGTLPAYGTARHPSPATLPADPAIVPEEPTPQVPQPMDPNELVIGSFMGVGNANESVESDQLASALESIANQANLSRDPQGQRISDGGSPAKRQQMAGLTIPESQDLRGLGAQAGMSRPVIGLPGIRQGVLGRSADPKSTSNEIEQAKGSPDERNPAPPAEGIDQQVDGKQRQATGAEAQDQQGQKDQQGQERPQSDTDSDFFSEDLDIEMRNGRLIARSGREVKFARPQINLAARADAVTLSFPIRLRLRIDVDEQGKVRRVTLLNSSGSSSIDRAIELSVYETWIEPAKRNGKPVRQTVTTTYSIY